MNNRDTSAPLDAAAAPAPGPDHRTKAAWQRPEMKRKVSVRKVTLFSGSSSTIVSP